MAHELRIGLSPKSVLMTLGMLLGVWALYQLQTVIFLIFVSCLMATALYPPVAWLKKKHLPKKISILIFYLLLVGLGGALLVAIVNALADEGQQFIQQIPAYIQDMTVYFMQFKVVQHHPQVLSDLSQGLQQILTQSASWMFSAFTYLFTVVSGMLGLIMVLVLTFYLLADTEYFEQTLIDLCPLSWQGHARYLLQAMAEKVGRYVRGQLLLMTTMGLVVGTVLTLLNVPYAYLLGFLSFVFEIIPMIGAFISASVGILLALSKSPILALWTALAYLVIQQLENAWFAPKILSRSIEIHPLWIILSILIGGTLFGLKGIFVSVPTAVILRLLWRTHFNPPDVLPPARQLPESS